MQKMENGWRRMQGRHRHRHRHSPGSDAQRGNEQPRDHSTKTVLRPDEREKSPGGRGWEEGIEETGRGGSEVMRGGGLKRREARQGEVR